MLKVVIRLSIFNDVYQELYEFIWMQNATIAVCAIN